MLNFSIKYMNYIIECMFSSYFSILMHIALFSPFSFWKILILIIGLGMFDLLKRSNTLKRIWIQGIKEETRRGHGPLE